MSENVTATEKASARLRIKMIRTPDLSEEEIARRIRMAYEVILNHRVQLLVENNTPPAEDLGRNTTDGVTTAGSGDAPEPRTSL